jgi:hypothetical protein
VIIAMFTVRLDIMADEEQRLRKLSRSLLDKADTLAMIQDGLTESMETEAMEEITEAMLKLRRSVQNEGENLAGMSDAIGNIRLQYKDTEQRIIAEAEEVALVHKNVSASYRDLSWYETKLSGMKFR